MTRQEAQDRLLDYVYGEIEGIDERELERWIDADEELRAEYEAMSGVQSAFAALPSVEMPANLRVSLLEEATRVASQRVEANEAAARAVMAAAAAPEPPAVAVERARRDAVAAESGPTWWEKLLALLMQPAFATALTVVLVAGVGLYVNEKGVFDAKEESLIGKLPAGTPVQAPTPVHEEVAAAQLGRGDGSGEPARSAREADKESNAVDESVVAGKVEAADKLAAVEDGESAGGAAAGSAGSMGSLRNGLGGLIGGSARRGAKLDDADTRRAGDSTASAATSSLAKSEDSLDADLPRATAAASPAPEETAKSNQKKLKAGEAVSGERGPALAVDGKLVDLDTALGATPSAAPSTPKGMAAPPALPDAVQSATGKRGSAEDRKATARPAAPAAKTKSDAYVPAPPGDGATYWDGSAEQKQKAVVGRPQRQEAQEASAQRRMLNTMEAEADDAPAQSADGWLADNRGLPNEVPNQELAGNATAKKQAARDDAKPSGGDTSGKDIAQLEAGAEGQAEGEATVGDSVRRGFGRASRAIGGGVANGSGVRGSASGLGVLSGSGAGAGGGGAADPSAADFASASTGLDQQADLAEKPASVDSVASGDSASRVDWGAMPPAEPEPEPSEEETVAEAESAPVAADPVPGAAPPVLQQTARERAPSSGTTLSTEAEGDLMALRGDWRGAAKAYRQAVVSNPSSDATRIKWAKALLAIGDTAGAEAALAGLTAPNSGEAQKLRTQIAERKSAGQGGSNAARSKKAAPAKAASEPSMDFEEMNVEPASKKK